MKRLKDICELIVDCEHNTAATQETGYPSIRTPNIGKGRLLLDGVNRVSEETYRRWTQRTVPQTGDLILAREAPIGNVAIIPSGLKVCLGQRTVLIRPDRKAVNPNYLTYLLLGDEIQGRIQSMSNGATVHHLNMKDIRELVMPSIPERRVQDRIADILSAYDDLIENNTRRIKILEEMAQMLYREWFVNFRFPGHENVKMIESELGVIPRGWQVKSIRQVASFIGRGISPTYDDHAEGIVINQKCIRDHCLSLEAARRQSRAAPTEKIVRKGDILINSTGVGTLGRVAQVHQEVPNCTTDSHVSIVRPQSHPEYLGQVALQLEPSFESLGVGSTGQTELGRERIGNVLFVCPPDPLQSTFSRHVGPLNLLIVCLMRQNENLRTTRDFLLPKLISGEIPVEAAQDTAAELVEQTA